MSAHGSATTQATGFGLALRQARERQHLSQAELAERAGLSHGAISRIESGSRHPSRETAIALADALNLVAISRIMFLGEAGLIEQPITRDIAVTLFWTTTEGLRE